MKVSIEKGTAQSLAFSGMGGSVLGLSLIGLLVLSPMTGQSPLTPELPETAKQRLVPAVHLRVTEYGLWPTRTTVPAGRIIIIVDGRAIGRRLGLRVEKQTRERVKDLNTAARGPRAGDFVELTPGKYTISVLERPEWTAEVVVEEKKPQ